MMEVIKHICDAAAEAELPNPTEWKSFSEAINGLKKAIYAETEKLLGEPGKVEAEYGGWGAEVKVDVDVWEDAGDHSTAPSWGVNNIEYQVLDLWQEGSNVSADLRLRKRFEEALNE